ncbi:unnamed protein product [Cuscuta europaea]|uniref:Integrase catalytic domain-containing protein n=1 Tax=Cuscuta europaea TaxID=41803 RepID=A0A9P0ZPB3_CUSEU|nr:unnamed protein product [Cuscuta europaea]
MWSFLLKHKSDASDVIKSFKRSIEKRTGKEIKSFHTDRGGEFTSRDSNRFWEEEGIARMLTAPYAPQQNGIAERRNRTLIEMTRCLMKAKGVPNRFWDEAVRHATFIINRTPTRALVGTTPYEKLYCEKPNLEDLKVFGCIAYDKIVSKHLKKLDDKSKPLVYFGKEPGSGGFRLYNPHENKIIISSYAICDENRAWEWSNLTDNENQIRKESGTFTVLWGETQPSQTDASLEQPAIQAHINGSNGKTISNPGSSSPRSDINSNLETSPPRVEFEPISNIAPTRRSSRTSVLPARFNDYELNFNELLLAFDEEPRNFNEARVKPEWLSAMKTEIDAVEKNKTWKLVPPPKDVKPIGLKWIFKIKRNVDGSISRYKARLVAKGYVQEPGIDFDEVFVPVARLETI